MCICLFTFGHILLISVAVFIISPAAGASHALEPEAENKHDEFEPSLRLPPRSSEAHPRVRFVRLGENARARQRMRDKRRISPALPPVHVHTGQGL